MTRGAGRGRVRTAMAIVALVVVPRLLPAQVTAAIAMLADVNTTALTITNPVALAFGTVTPGVATVVDPQTSASAGVFVIQGAKRAEILITLTLPTVLRAGAGPVTMPITFGAQGGCYRPRNQQAACTYWDPSTPLIDRIRNQNPPNNHYYVWLGGTVTPAAAQPAGVYTATITLTVVYTGN